MEWLVILGLGAWVWLQSRHIRTLKLKLAELEHALARPPAAVPTPQPANEEALLLTEAVRDDELLLDTPLPDTANDIDAEAAGGRAPEFAWPGPPSWMEGAATLALALGLLAPALTDFRDWPAPTITGSLGLAAIAGFGVAAWRRWPWLALMTLSGLYLWFAFAMGAADNWRAMALLGLAATGGAAMALRPPRVGDENGFGWSQVHAALPAIAIVISSVLALWTWFDTSSTGLGRAQDPTILGLLLIALAALAVRARAAAPATFIVAVATFVVGYAAHLNVREGALSASFYPLLLCSAVFIVAVASLVARPAPEARIQVAGIGALAASALTVLAGFSRRDWHGVEAYAPLLGVAALLFATAWLAARGAEDAKADNVVDIWAAAGALLAMLGVESAFAEPMRVIAHAALSLGFAAAYMRLEWRVTRYAALLAGALSLAHAVGPNMFLLAGDGALTLTTAIAIVAASALLLLLASRLAARVAAHSVTAELLTLGAFLAPVIIAFFLLHLLRARDVLDEFTLYALRAIILLVAGLAFMPRGDRARGDVARWRGHLVAGAGVAVALIWPAILLNPWWGGGNAASIAGPLLFNPQALALLVPGVLTFIAAARTYTHDHEPARLFAIAGGALSLVWAILELRRIFQGAAMNTTALGLFEAGCYALLALVTALAVAIVARVRGSKDPGRPFTRDVLNIMRGVAGASVVIALVLMLGWRHPWWGAQDASLTSASETGWAVMAQAAALALSLWLARVLSTSRPAEPARFAVAAAAALFALSFGSAGVRWLYHRGAMDDGVALAGLEGLAYAVWPLLFVSMAAYFTARAPGRDAERAYLYDLQAIWAAAIWPALAFAALGLWALFNPWWGAWPVRASNLGGFLTILAGFGLASCLSIVAARVPYVRARRWLARGGVAMGAAHLSVAAIMLTRRVFHHQDMSTAATPTHELWVYVAVWCAIAVAAFIVGTRRGNMGLRWFGIGLMGLAIAYAFALAFTRMSGGAQVGAILSIALTPFAAVWAVRTFKPPARMLRESDFKDVTPSARRERRRARRYRTP